MLKHSLPALSNAHLELQLQLQLLTMLSQYVSWHPHTRAWSILPGREVFRRCAKRSSPFLAASSVKETKKTMLRKRLGKNTSLYFPFFSSSNLMKWINYTHYHCYLAGMDILHCFRDLHCWSAQVSAILANFLDGEL